MLVTYYLYNLGTADRYPKENCTNTSVIIDMRMKCHGEVGQIIFKYKLNNCISSKKTVSMIISHENTGIVH